MPVSKDIMSRLVELGYSVAARHKIVGQTKLQEIEVDELVFDELFEEFFVQNLIRQDITFEEIHGILQFAFPYFYDRGIEAAAYKYAGSNSQPDFDQVAMLNLEEPPFPVEMTMYINSAALMEMYMLMHDFVVNNKSQFEEDYSDEDIARSILLFAFNAGVELATEINLPLASAKKRASFEDDLKCDSLVDGGDVLEIHCPFCGHCVYQIPKETSLRSHALINNCSHISLQFVEGQDEKFLIGEGFRPIFEAAAKNFLNEKGQAFMMSIHDFMEEPNYTLDNFFFDMYIGEKFSPSDEMMFLETLNESLGNYIVKASAHRIIERMIVNYFMKELI